MKSKPSCFYHLNLQGALDLPISTQGMLYPGMSGVTPEMLIAAKQLVMDVSDKELLDRSEPWQIRMSHRHKEAALNVNEKFCELLKTAKKYYKLPTENRQSWLIDHPQLNEIVLDTEIKNYLDASNAIMRAQEIALAHLGGSDSKDPAVRSSAL